MPLSAQQQTIWTRLDFTGDAPAMERAAPRPRPPAPTFMARRRRDVLAHAIRQDIVPRLLLARGVAPAPAVPCVDAPSSLEVAALADIVLRHELAEAVSFVEGLARRGVGVEAIHLDLLAPVARRLGALWEDDLLDFGRVTIGLARLQQVMGTLGKPFHEDPRRSPKPRILLVPAPGDSHSFGMSMVASFFQRAGWGGWSGMPGSTPDLVRMVRDGHFAIVGFSASCHRRMDALSGAIRAVRRASMNRGIRIMVGGPLFAMQPELVALVGADATATDGRQAVLQAQNLLTLIPGQA